MNENAKNEELEAATAHLSAVPAGETLWIGLTGFMKHRRGDWVEIASGPVRFTSRDLVTMMAARHEPPLITKLLQDYHAEEILSAAKPKRPAGPTGYAPSFTTDEYGQITENEA